MTMTKAELMQLLEPLNDNDVILLSEAAIRKLRSDTVLKESELPDANINKLQLRLCWLTDGEWLSRSAWFTDEEFAEEQVKAYDASGGSIWWVQRDIEPDLPRSYGFQHISRELRKEGSCY